jgi:hypothetical protein
MDLLLFVGGSQSQLTCGLNSPEETPPLKPVVVDWLSRPPVNTIGQLSQSQLGAEAT